MLVSPDLRAAAVVVRFDAGLPDAERVQADLARLTPIMLLLLGLALVWIFRERVSVALALAAVVLPSVWVFGLMGWTNRPVTPVVSTLPILILVGGRAP